MILLGISFIAGILTVLAPCTIALLPVIVGGSLGEKQSLKRALVVTSSLGVSVILFTFILKVSTAFINVPQAFWQIFSGVIILLIGISMIFPSLYENLPFMNKFSRDSNKVLAVGYQKKNLWGDIITGAALGPVFSSCSPTYFLILATVLPHSFATGFIYLLAYAVGLSGGLLVVTFAGQKLLQKLGIASDPRGIIKRTIGVLFLIIGIAICFGYDKTLEAGITNAGYFDFTQIEQKLLAAHGPKTGLLPAAQTQSAVNNSVNPATPSDSANTSSNNSGTQSTAPTALSTAERIFEISESTGDY